MYNHSVSNIGARILSLGQLLRDQTLVIPHYQRPYTWTEKQVSPLLNDLWKIEKDQTLIMGSVILHKNVSNETEIVDGQQRLTTFAILGLLAGKEEDNKLLKMDFPHEISKQNIRANASYIQKFIDRKGNNQLPVSFENIFFIVIHAPELDDAFSFFDSQNTRGKKLEDYDILKAHHLRYIGDDRLAEHCAVRWEAMQKDTSVSMKLLLESILGRGRKWSRKEYDEVDIKKEFKSQRFRAKKADTYPVNRYQQPPVFGKWKYDPLRENGLDLIFRLTDAAYKINGLQVSGDGVGYLPFQVNQAIEGGELFFWYTQKYYRLYQEIFVMPNDDRSAYFGRLLATVSRFNYNSGSNYVYECFTGAILFYVDKFGYEQIDTIATYLFFSCYYLRFKQSTVQYASVFKYVRETFNPFSLIQKAGYPDYIINRCETFLEGKYREDEIHAKGIRSLISAKLFSDDPESVYRKYKTHLPAILPFN